MNAAVFYLRTYVKILTQLLNFENFWKGTTIFMEKILPFTMDVPLKAFTYYSVYLGILKMHGVDIITLLLNHFITINYVHANGFFTYREERKLKKLFSHDKFSSDLENPQEFIKDAIDTGSYIFVDLNHAYISSLPIRISIVHEFIIYGYDDETKQFFASGYIANEKLKGLHLQDIRISYDDLTLSYHSAHNLKKKKHHNFVIKMKNRNIVTTLNIKKIKIALFLYIYNILPYLFFNSFNRRAYKMYRKHFIKINKSGNRFFDTRFLKVMQERTVLFKLLIIELSFENELIDKCNDLYNTATKALMLAAKCNANNTDRLKVYEKINIFLERIEEQEYEIVNILYGLLCSRE